MPITVDLHLHSSYAGGTGKISIENIDNAAPMKGIDIMGTGDIQFPPWKKELESKLKIQENGIYKLEENGKTGFILQTEIIFTVPFKDKRKESHTIFLFPSFEAVNKFYNLLKSWNVAADKIGRPFIKCISVENLSEKINKIISIENFVEIIPAHILTPLGVYGGSKVKINRLEEYYGDSADNIRIVETGLSADPVLLGLIPELDNMTLLSNSDAHSLALHRIGREFTSLKIEPPLSYEKIIKSLRNGKVEFTAEFFPTEGRFFLTGHRGGKYLPKDKSKITNSKTKKWHNPNEYCFFSPKNSPKDDICPICNKKLSVGALQRAFEINFEQGGYNRNLTNVIPKQNFIHMIPLIEIIANSLNIKTLTSKTVVKNYIDIVNVIGSEVQLWKLDINEVMKKLENKCNSKIIDNINLVSQGNFRYFPLGYDGTYGELVIGKKQELDYLDLKEIKRD